MSSYIIPSYSLLSTKQMLNLTPKKTKKKIFLIAMLKRYFFANKAKKKHTHK